ncbi:25491_t:CDS:2, partial [Racocetra persica]
QRLFDIASYIDMTNDRIGYENCRLKGIEQVDDNEINERVTNIISETNDGIKQTKEIKIKNIPVSNLFEWYLDIDEDEMIKKEANSNKREIDNTEEQIIKKTSSEVEIDEIKRKNVKVSSINDDERGDKKSEDSPEQNYEANDLENCYGNRIGDSRSGEKCKMTAKVGNVLMDLLNQVHVLIRMLKDEDYAEGFVRLNGLSCRCKDAKAGMLSTLKLYGDKDLEKQ